MDALYNNPIIAIVAVGFGLALLYSIVSMIQKSANSRRARRIIEKSKPKQRSPAAQHVHETVAVTSEEEIETWVDRATSVTLKVMGVVFVLFITYMFIPNRYLPESMGGDSAAKKEARAREEFMRRASKAKMIPTEEATPVATPPATPAVAAPANFTPPAPVATAVPTAPKPIKMVGKKQLQQCTVYAQVEGMIYFTKLSRNAKNMVHTRSIRVRAPEGGPSGEISKPELGEFGAMVYPTEGCFVDRGAGKVPCDSIKVPGGDEFALALCE